MDNLPNLLICDDDTTFHLAVKHSLKGKYQCRSAYNCDEALTIIKNYSIDILLLDVQIRTRDEGLKYLPSLQQADEDLAVIMSSGLTDFATVREAMRLGAVDFIPKDFDPNELLLTITRVAERRKLLKRNEQQNFEVASHQKKHLLLGVSPEIQELKRILEKINRSEANVMILGETGTGKEVVARQLRKLLPDGSLAPFVAVDSATIQGGTAESMLFGHEKGAFTGAERTTKGVFEEANGGVVYFDEISNMPIDIQAKLLRVLQEKEVTRVGSSKVIPLEFRVVCATNRDLDTMSKAGQFKDDLLQRLNVLPITLAPLRDRLEDIPILIRHFAQVQAAGKAPLQFTGNALEALAAYKWPGNIRELANIVAYLVAMTDGTEVDFSDLPPRFRTPSKGRTYATPENRNNFYVRVGKFESALLAIEYQRHSGNISKLALTLGMDRSHLYTKLREYGLHLKTGEKAGTPN